jgi:hypothetical protein
MYSMCSQIVPRIWISRPSCMICEKANLWRIQTKNVMKSDEKWTLNIPIYENTPSYPTFLLYAHSRNFIIHKYWHTHKHKVLINYSPSCMSVRYSTPRVHYPQLNSSRVCLSTNFQKYKCHIFICVCVCVSIYEL